MRALRDWSNRPVDGYTTEEWRLLEEQDMLFVAGRAVFHPEARLSEQLERVHIVPRVGLLHTFTDERYDSGAWPWQTVEGSVLKGTALNYPGTDEPIPRWRYADDEPIYNTDPTKADPVAYAWLVAMQCKQWHYDWVLLDYFSEQPWDYDNSESVVVPGLTSAWWLWQRIVVTVLHKHGIKVVGNGKAAIANAAALNLDMVYVEKCGTLWWTPHTAIQHVREGWVRPTDHDDTGVGFTCLDITRGPKAGTVELQSFAEGCAASNEAYMVMHTLVDGGS